VSLIGHYPEKMYYVAMKIQLKQYLVVVFRPSGCKVTQTYPSPMLDISGKKADKRKGY